MYYTDDPVKDAERYAADRDEELEQLPVCDYCGEHIQDEFCYKIDDDILCRKCVDYLYRHRTTDL